MIYDIPLIEVKSSVLLAVGYEQQFRCIKIFVMQNLWDKSSIVLFGTDTTVQ